MVKVFEAFAGYGSQYLALKRLGIECEVVGISEIDNYALKAYEAIHQELSQNYGDISQINWEEVPDFDLFTYSFPCQDISLMGEKKGLAEGSGTRSSLLWECKKAIEIKKPRVLLLENVKNLVGKKNKPDFDKWLNYLESLGYKNYWKVINAKDCGIPQNRERVFVVSFLDNSEFEFPPKKEMLSLDALNIPHPIITKNYGRVASHDEWCPTLIRATGGGHIPTIEEGRKLTPYECSLLMGLKPDEAKKLCESGLSNTRLYNCLGNSIVVDVLEGIFKGIYKDEIITT